jgi:hypothetical protein
MGPTTQANAVDWQSGSPPLLLFRRHSGQSVTESGCFVSFAQQSDFLVHGVDRFLRASIIGRTCAGGSIPRSSAQASFSSSVKQQQSPFQHSSAETQPQPRFSQGYRTVSVETGDDRTAGKGIPRTANK